MSAARTHRYEHARLRVPDIGEALDFCQRVLGLVEIAREGEVSYLGCGYGAGFDLAIEQGDPALAHFALRVEDMTALAGYRDRLAQAGIRVDDLADAEPGIEAGALFEAPSGHLIELVVVADQQYVVPSQPAHRVSGFGPLDADHINLMARDVKGLAEFLVATLGFRISDASEPQAGLWTAAWTRMGSAHHDVGIFLTEAPAQSLHHLAWSCSNFEHMKMLADRLAANSIKLELGMSRHPVGANLYAYFWAPGGHRFELTAEGATVEDRAPMRTWSDMGDTLDAWGAAVVPESMFGGS